MVLRTQPAGNLARGAHNVLRSVGEPMFDLAHVWASTWATKPEEYAGIFHGIGRRAAEGNATAPNAEQQGRNADRYLDRALEVMAPRSSPQTRSARCRESH
jgi:hypothetical protein